MSVDLLTNPAWQAASLGQPLPQGPHGVSVSLPLWSHVLGYEENDPAVTRQMRSGYPRFFLPERITQCFQVAAEELGAAGEAAYVFPTAAAAERCAGFAGEGVRVAAFRQDTAAVLFQKSHPTAPQRVKLFWRFSGEVISTRVAERLLSRNPKPENGPQAFATVQKRLARLYGVPAEAVFLFPSGMAAVFAVHRMLCALRPGLPSLQLDFPYVDVLKVQQEFGNPCLFHPVASPEALAETQRLGAAGALSGVFCEVPSNPLLRAVPLAQLAPSLRQGGVPLIVDDTVATVVNVAALKFADVVTTSLTKSFSGQGNVLAGSVVLNPQSPYFRAFQAFLATGSEILAGDDAVVLEENSRDFPKRVKRMNFNAQAVAAHLRQQPSVAQVFYPQADQLSGLEDVLRPGGGYGCLLSFTLKDPAQTPALYDSLRFCKGPSLGNIFSLLCPYTLLAHYTELDWAEQCGVSRHLLRLSVGLEETSELLSRLAFDS
jgi:cystathionine gamma-synthase